MSRIGGERLSGARSARIAMREVNSPVPRAQICVQELQGFLQLWPCSELHVHFSSETWKLIKLVQAPAIALNNLSSGFRASGSFEQPSVKRFPLSN